MEMLVTFLLVLCVASDKWIDENVSVTEGDEDLIPFDGRRLGVDGIIGLSASQGCLDCCGNKGCDKAFRNQMAGMCCISNGPNSNCCPAQTTCSGNGCMRPMTHMRTVTHRYGGGYGYGGYHHYTYGGGGGIGALLMLCLVGFVLVLCCWALNNRSRGGGIQGGPVMGGGYGYGDGGGGFFSGLLMGEMLTMPMWGGGMGGWGGGDATYVTDTYGGGEMMAGDGGGWGGGGDFGGGDFGGGDGGDF